MAVMVYRKRWPCISPIFSTSWTIDTWNPIFLRPPKHWGLKRVSDAVDYGRFKNNGWPVGSGEVESAHRLPDDNHRKWPLEEVPRGDDHTHCSLVNGSLDSVATTDS